MRSALRWGWRRFCTEPTSRQPAKMTFDYPKARRSDFTEELHGRKRCDPYRWMEEPDNQELKDWARKQTELTEQYLQKVEFREKIREKVKGQLDFERTGQPYKRGDYWYYSYNPGLKNHSMIYQKKDIFDKEEKPRVFLDPNTFSEDGTTGLSTMAFSDDGKMLAYSKTKKGSDWQVVYILNCDTLEHLGDELHWVKHSGVRWTRDNKGFFYARYDAPKGVKDADDAALGHSTERSVNQRLHYHFVGEKQEQDPLVYHDPANETQMYGGSVTHDGRYAVIEVCRGCHPESKLWVIDLQKVDLRNVKAGDVQKLIDEFETEVDYVWCEDGWFYCVTTKDASNKRVIKFHLERPAEWIDVVPERNCVLEWAAVGWNGSLFLQYLEDVKDVLYLSTLSEPMKQVTVPFDIGSVGLSSSFKHPQVFMSVTTFSYPNKILQFSLEGWKAGDAVEPKFFHEDVVKDFDSSKFTVEQHFFESHDGAKVPMFVVYKKGMKFDGNNLALMYGYGGFRVNMGIYFSASRAVLMDNLNGVYVQVNIRGGLEYGEDWWKGGSQRNKMNCYHDFNAAAEALFAKKITSPAKLCINGGSNGGTLVAACANLKPDLFAAVVPDVGVMDMTRFHKFTIGSAWTSDFGNPDEEGDFDYILKYSPLHNIDGAKKYPPIMVLTGDHDNRVSPLHTYKYLAELQHQCGNQGQPLLGRIDLDSGHGAGKPLSKTIAEIVDRYCFYCASTGTTWQD